MIGEASSRAAGAPVKGPVFVVRPIRVHFDRGCRMAVGAITATALVLTDASGSERARLAERLCNGENAAPAQTLVGAIGQLG